MNLSSEFIKSAILAGIVFLAIKLLIFVIAEMKDMRIKKDLLFANLDASEGIMLYWAERRKSEPNLVRSMPIQKELNILSIISQQSKDIEDFENKLYLSEINYCYDHYLQAKELKLGKAKYISHLKFNHKNHN